MSTATPETEQTNAGEAQTPETQAPAAPEQEAKTETKAPWGDNSEFDPDKAARLIENLRADKAKADAKVQDAETKAQQDADAKIRAILQAAGYEAKEDEDPVAAAETQAQENATRAETAEAERDQARRELAVYKTAKGADVDALLDSTSFLNSIKDIAADDVEGIETAVNKAVENNPRFKAAQAAGQSGGDFTGSSGEGQVTQEQFDNMPPSEKNELFKTNPTRYRQLTGRE